jgi:hypothetical protein
MVRAFMGAACSRDWAEPGPVVVVVVADNSIMSRARNPAVSGRCRLGGVPKFPDAFDGAQDAIGGGVEVEGSHGFSFWMPVDRVLRGIWRLVRVPVTDGFALARSLEQHAAASAMGVLPPSVLGKLVTL